MWREKKYILKPDTKLSQKKRRNMEQIHIIIKEKKGKKIEPKLWKFPTSVSYYSTQNWNIISKDFFCINIVTIASKKVFFLLSRIKLFEWTKKIAKTTKKNNTLRWFST